MTKYNHLYYTDNTVFECTIEAEPADICQIRDEKGGFEPDYADSVYVTEVKHNDIDIYNVIAEDVLFTIVEQFLSVNNSL